MNRRKRKEYKELKDPHNIPYLAGSLLFSEKEAVFYKTLHNIDFYTIQNCICFKTDDIQPKFVVVGKVGVSDDEMLLEDFNRVIDFLDMQSILQSKLF